MTSLLAPIENTPYVGGTANSYITVDVNGLQVTLTGIDGELLTWSSAGVPATVAAGSSAQVLTSNGAGAAPTFQAAAVASPGGSDAQVQYNNATAFGGMAGVAWDDVANELTITAQAADDVPLKLVPHASQTANIQTWGTDVARVNAAGDFSNTQGGDRGEVFGDGATIDGDGRQVAFGFEASSVGTESMAFGANSSATQGGLAIGSSSSVTGFQGVAIGQGAAAGVSGFGFGASAVAGSQGVCFGTSSSATFGVAIGHKAKTTANFQLVVGGTGGGGSNAIHHVYIGEGVESATTINVTHHSSRGLGTNIVAGKYIIAPGESTGNATPSTIILQGTTVGSSGTSVQTLADVLTITDAATITVADAVNFVLNATAGTKIGTATTQKLAFFNATPIVQPTEITDELTSITHTAPGTPDFAIQDLIDSGVGSAFGFATKDEGNTVLSVILNLQARVNELETVLSSLGLVADAD